MSRTRAAISGGAGLAAALLAAGGCLLARRAWPVALLSHPLAAWGLFVFFGGIALIEIPVMVFGLRKLAAAQNTRAAAIAAAANGGFVFFAAVYALPNLLLTETRFLWLGLLLAGTSFLRFGAGLLFLPQSGRP